MEFRFHITDYKDALDEAQSIQDLRQAAELLEDCKTSALVSIESLTEADFPAFVTGRDGERAGVFAGEEWWKKFGDIMMPAETIPLSVLAQKYGVSFGVAYLQAKQDPEFFQKLIQPRGPHAGRDHSHGGSEPGSQAGS